MKTRAALFLAAFLALVSVLHASWNIGWDNLREDLRTLMGGERLVMNVGFLPVT